MKHGTPELSQPFRLNEAIMWEFRDKGELGTNFANPLIVRESRFLEFPFVVIKRELSIPLIFIAVRVDQYPLLWVWWLLILNIEEFATCVGKHILFALWKFGIYKNYDCGSDFTFKNLFQNLFTKDSGFKYIDSLHYKCNLTKPWYKRALFWQP